MEGHFVPKNITEFQFHLVGDMTLRQFLYLALGLGTAYLLFVIVVPTAPVVAWPLIIISAAAGGAFAFLPFADRSLDHWTVTYFKAIFNPTQRVWRLPFLNFNPQLFQNRLSLYLSSLAESSPVQQPTPASLSSFIAVSTPASSPPLVQPTKPSAPPTKQQAPPSQQPAVSEEGISVEKEYFQQTQVAPPTKDWLSIPSTEELDKTVSLAKQAQAVQIQIINTQKALGEIKQKAVVPGADPKKFQVEFQQVLGTLQRLNQEASDISRQFAILSKSPAAQLPQTKVKIIAKPEQINKQIELTVTPNIINGIVTDSQGGYLQGVIVVTHDKQGLPVRALKTNKLGQFIAATPLGNGVYTITLEKDNLLFDVLEIELKGQVMSPIRVSAKKGGAIG